MSKMTLREMKSWLEESSIDEKTLESFLQMDGRKGVRELIQKRLRLIRRKEDEENRLERLMLFERELWNRGLQLIAGVDEVGRGPLAGPVVAAAVILPVNKKIYEVRDSKQLSPKKREQLYFCIKKEAVCYSLGIVDVLYIDQFNISQAGLEAMRRALNGLEKKPEHILIDAFAVPNITISQTPLVKGDTLSLTIACASILAKVTRDKLMEDYDRQYPQYGFAQHKGYGTGEHYAAIKKYGISPIHRRSFRLEAERG
ncbi:ribonuclease HII [Candidatus Contubernalis alkalaceticus]|nr:ribonuclease HII [Candidatus Contubernalis alkalaceticus]